MRGVVEKCNFCEERLARGETPACVQACPAGALIFGDTLDAGSQVRHVLQSNYTVRRRPGLGTLPQVFYIA
jgi:molybdopterin-containing oxidoreductase family iron-sulfur binding subunit